MALLTEPATTNRARSSSNISVHPIYDNSREAQIRRQNGNPTIIGFRASNTLSVRIDDIDRVGEVIDGAIKSGINQLNGVSFQSRDPFEAHTQALAQATLRAKAKATVMAGAMGAKIVSVLVATESGASTPPRAYNRGRATMETSMMRSAPTPIEPGSLTIRASVSITYKLSFPKE